MDVNEKITLLADMLEITPAELSAETVLDSIPNWDSMAALSLIALLEEHFDRADIDGSQIKHMKTVADIMVVMEKLNG